MSLYCKRNVTPHAPSSSRIVGTYSGAFSYQVITKCTKPRKENDRSRMTAGSMEACQSKRIITMTAGDAKDAS